MIDPPLQAASRIVACQCRCLFSARFFRFVELDSPGEVTVRRTGSGWRSEVHQAGKLAARAEWAIGGSDGWRLPGYSGSVEPGVSISHGRDFLEVTAPVAVYRYGITSVPFARTHDPFGGIASFSDFQINVTYSHLF